MSEVVCKSQIGPVSHVTGAKEEPMQEVNLTQHLLSPDVTPSSPLNWWKSLKLIRVIGYINLIKIKK